MPSPSSAVTKVAKFGGTLFITLADGTKVEALSSEVLTRQIESGDVALDLEGELELAQSAEKFLASQQP